ncbi:hypothetical protein DER45DRAFT_568929 [Fusarium avenaceum]|nr:hypothetical protein DER45DRAFT_568929 [Fusarium avenaceum]
MSCMFGLLCGLVSNCHWSAMTFPLSNSNARWMTLETGAFIELILADRCCLSQFKQSIILFMCYSAGREHCRCMPMTRLR